MQTGIFDRSRLITNILLLILVAGNLYLGVQYSQNIKADNAKVESEILKADQKLKVSKFMKLFIDKVLGTGGDISFEDRVKLESDIRALEDESLVKQWDVFVASKDSAEAQKSAVLLMSMLMNKMII